jgi:TIR domain/AAA ATPase domain
MADGTAKPVIFISYSHKDEPEHVREGEVQWLSFVRTYLQPAIKTGVFDLFVDEHLAGGADLKPEIEAKLRACDVFVLLISVNSTASDYIVDTEIRIARDREAAGDDICFYPILLTPTPKVALDKLKDKVIRPKDANPLSSFSYSERIQKITEIADEIAMIADEIVRRKPEPSRREPQPPFVHISGLPETPYERLVGRENELKRLDEAWLDSKTNILSLIAEGGAGKSALVNEWLRQLQADNYRAAEAVFGWSFYNQGTKERTTSAEEFLDWALDKFEINAATVGATAKGEAIAEAMMRHRVLVILDGVEPLQHGLDTQFGQLKDQGLRALLRRFAATPPSTTHGLIVLTSRIPITDIARWRNSAARVIDIERLSDETGARILRDNGAWGTDQELKSAAHEFEGHPLALGLLASFIKETQVGDIRRRDHIRNYFADPNNPRHDHAKRVMESYEKEWLIGQPVLLAIMRIVGLFDRPASEACLKALRERPIIEGLTDQIVMLDDSEWERAAARLRDVRLLAPMDRASPNSLDAHPLVREWFGERLNQLNEKAWKAAHGRLYVHLRNTTKEGNNPTIESIAPLYDAVAHGCCSGRQQETLDEIYAARICQRDETGELIYYSKNILAAFGSDLVAISWFFDKPYEIPSNALTESAARWIVSEAATCLLAQTRLSEALAALRASALREQNAKSWDNASASLSALCEAHIILGEIGLALEESARAIAVGDNGDSEDDKLKNRAQHAIALHAAGRSQDAESLFARIERQVLKLYHGQHQLISVAGAGYSSLLGDKGQWIAVRQRSQTSLGIAERMGRLLDISLANLALGKANLALALKYGPNQSDKSSTQKEQFGLLSILASITGFQRYGNNGYVPMGLLARAAFHRSAGDWSAAMSDLDEVEEIAEPGPMRLHLCDTALERARLAFVRIEAFAPLSGMLERESDDVPKPNLPIAELRDEAEKQLKIAAGYIEQCGYHRRDDELAELQAVLRGEKKFADLPPRV